MRPYGGAKPVHRRGPADRHRPEVAGTHSGQLLSRLGSQSTSVGQIAQQNVGTGRRTASNESVPVRDFQYGEALASHLICRLSPVVT